jgi:hypothetical protein
MRKKVNRHNGDETPGARAERLQQLHIAVDRARRDVADSEIGKLKKTLKGRHWTMSEAPKRQIELVRVALDPTDGLISVTVVSGIPPDTRQKLAITLVDSIMEILGRDVLAAVRRLHPPDHVTIKH